MVPSNSISGATCAPDTSGSQPQPISGLNGGSIRCPPAGAGYHVELETNLRFVKLSLKFHNHGEGRHQNRFLKSLMIFMSVSDLVWNLFPDYETSNFAKVRFQLYYDGIIETEVLGVSSINSLVTIVASVRCQNLPA